MIGPHRVRLDFDEHLCTALQYAVLNQLHIQVWPAGSIIPKQFEIKHDWTIDGYDERGLPRYQSGDRYMEVEW